MTPSSFVVSKTPSSFVVSTHVVCRCVGLGDVDR